MAQEKQLITVPDLTTEQLLDQADQALKLTYLTADFETWDFVRFERGKIYEVLVWTPGREVMTYEVQQYFESLKADGNTAAFVAWVAKADPEGRHASIPLNYSRLFRSGKCLYAPTFFRDRDYRGLGHGDDIAKLWDDDWSFVGFRPVEPVPR